IGDHPEPLRSCAVAGLRISILIVCHRHVALLAGCLESLRRNLNGAVDVETIVLFNGTPEAEREQVRDLLEADRIIVSPVNLGFGRGLPPGSRRYDYLREVDYVSACSLLVRRATFEQLGGFDERFFPGYNEDVDLCLGIRRLRQRVLYQPRSVVVHHESQTGA